MTTRTGKRRPRRYTATTTTTTGGALVVRITPSHTPTTGGRKRTTRKARTTRGAAAKSKRDGGVSHAHAVAYGKRLGSLGITVHTAPGKRPRGFTAADAEVAQRAAEAQRRKVYGKKRKAR